MKGLIKKITTTATSVKLPKANSEKTAATAYYSRFTTTLRSNNIISGRIFDEQTILNSASTTEKNVFVSFSSDYLLSSSSIATSSSETASPSSSSFFSHQQNSSMSPIEIVTPIFFNEHEITALNNRNNNNCTTITCFDQNFNNTSQVKQTADFPVIPAHILLCAWQGWDFIDIILFVIGTFGNAFSLILMRRRGLRSRSYALSLSVLALFNSLTLFVLGIQAGDRLLQKHFDLKGRLSIEAHIGTIGCKFYRIALPIVQLMSHWTVVFITTERFVAICFPLALPIFFSPTKSRITVACLFGTVVLSQSWRPFFDYQEGPQYENGTNGSIELKHAPECSAYPQDTFTNVDLFYHQLLMLCLLPAILIFVMNSAVVVKVYQVGREVRRAGGFHRGGQSNASVSHRSANSNSRPTSLKGKPSSAAPNQPQHEQRALFHCNFNHRQSPATNNGEPQSAIGGGRPHSVRDSSRSRSRKTTVLLLAVSCSFFVHISPFLSLFMYIRILHLVVGHPTAMVEFYNLCVPMKAAALLTNLSYADNFVIYLLAGERFRSEVRLMVLKVMAFCFPVIFGQTYSREVARSNRTNIYSNEPSNGYGGGGGRQQRFNSSPSVLKTLAENTLRSEPSLHLTHTLSMSTTAARETSDADGGNLAQQKSERLQYALVKKATEINRDKIPPDEEISVRVVEEESSADEVQGDNIMNNNPAASSSENNPAVADNKNNNNKKHDISKQEDEQNNGNNIKDNNEQIDDEQEQDEASINLLRDEEDSGSNDSKNNNNSGKKKPCEETAAVKNKRRRRNNKASAINRNLKLIN